MPARTCDFCRRFFARHACTAQSHGECDCPKCQGYCRCHEHAEPETDRSSSTED